MPKIKTSKPQLLERCIEVFKKQGYANTTMADVAAACDIEKAHLYYYFPNKEQLMREAMELFYQKAKTQIFDLAYDETKPITVRLQLVLEGLEKLFNATQRGCLVADTVLQTRYEGDTFTPIAQLFFKDLIAAIAHVYQDRYSATYSVFKAEQAVNDLYGGLVLSLVFDDYEYFKNALKRIGKKV